MLTPEHQAFHRHLDACAHCRHHPLDLCPIGAGLLLAAARSIRTAAPASLSIPAEPAD